MTNTMLSLTSAQLIALATPEAKAEMKRRMANTKRLGGKATAAKVRAFNAMAEALGLSERMNKSRKDGTSVCFAKVEPKVVSQPKAKAPKAKSAPKAKAPAKKSAPAKATQGQRITALESRMGNIEAQLEQLNANFSRLFSGK